MPDAIGSPWTSQTAPRLIAEPFGPSFYKFINGLTETVDGGLIALLHRVDDTVLNVILENHFADIIDGGADSGNLHQYLGAVPAFFYHLFNRFQVADGPG